MANLSILIDNPYRILGVYTNSPKKEIVSNKGRISAFLKVGKQVEFPLDLNTLFPVVQRDTESISQAESQISLAKEQIKYILFWFVNITPIDKIAFNHLQAGDIDSAVAIWGKKDSFSSLQNILVCSLIQRDWKKAFFYAKALYEKYAENILNLLDTQISLTSLDLVHLFIDTLFEEKDIDHKQFLNCVTTDVEWSTYIKDKLVQPLIASISREVEKVHAVKRENHKERYLAGNTLKKNTAMALANLKALVLSSDVHYQIIADKLGLEILQCGIDYYNASEELDAAIKAMPLQKYALSIVVGKAAKDRCKENVDILQKMIDELPPKEVFIEDKAIKEELRKFCSLPDKICHSKTLLNNTKSYLQSIKTKLGISHSFYLKLSTQVVGNALHNVIEEVNDIQDKMNISSYGYERSYEKRLRIQSMLPVLKNTLQEAWNTIKIMDTFDMEGDFKQNRYIPNKNTLKNICNQLGINTYQSNSVSRSSQPNKSSANSSDDETNLGCIIVIVIFIIIVILVNS